MAHDEEHFLFYITKSNISSLIKQVISDSNQNSVIIMSFVFGGKNEIGVINIIHKLKAIQTY